MLGRRRRAPVAGNVVEDGAHLFEHAVALGESAALIEGNPGALVLAIAALNLFVHAFLHLALEDARASGLVVVGDFEDVGCVDPVVGTTAHDVVAIDIAFIDRDIAIRGRVDLAIRRGGHFDHVGG